MFLGVKKPIIVTLTLITLIVLLAYSSTTLTVAKLYQDREVSSNGIVTYSFPWAQDHHGTPACGLSGATCSYLDDYAGNPRSDLTECDGFADFREAYGLGYKNGSLVLWVRDDNGTQGGCDHAYYNRMEKHQSCDYKRNGVFYNCGGKSSHV